MSVPAPKTARTRNNDKLIRVGLLRGVEEENKSGVREALEECFQVENDGKPYHIARRRSPHIPEYAANYVSPYGQKK